MKGEGPATLSSWSLPASKDTRPLFVLQPHPVPNFFCVRGHDSGTAGVWQDLRSGSSPHPPKQTRTPTSQPRACFEARAETLPALPSPFHKNLDTVAGQVDTEIWSAGAGLPTGPGVRKPKLSKGWSFVARTQPPHPPSRPGATAQVWLLPSTPWRHPGRHPERAPHLPRGGGRFLTAEGWG